MCILEGEAEASHCKASAHEREGARRKYDCVGGDLQNGAYATSRLVGNFSLKSDSDVPNNMTFPKPKRSVRYTFATAAAT